MFHAGSPLALLQPAYGDVEDVNTALSAPLDVLCENHEFRKVQLASVDCLEVHLHTRKIEVA